MLTNAPIGRTTYYSHLPIQKTRLEIHGVEENFYYVLDRFIGYEIWKHNIYEPITTKYLIEIISTFQDPFIFLDIGAHWGYYSLICAKLAPHSQVYSFEPLPFNFRLLERNTGSFPGVHRFNYAVSRQSGVKDLYIDVYNTGHNALAPQKDGVSGDTKQQIIKCESSTLDGFGIDFHKVKLVKIDTEETALDVLGEVTRHIISGTLILFEIMSHYLVGGDLPTYIKKDYHCLGVIEGDKFLLEKR